MTASGQPAIDDVLHMARPGGFMARLKGPAVGITVLHKGLPEPR
jgi:hypothetical protein